MVGIGERAENLLRESIRSKGVELVHIECQPQGGKLTLRIYIDKPGGVNLDDCTRVSRHVNILLDVENLIAHRYVLEVSSLGIERPLFTESDYKNHTGNEVQLRTKEKIEDRKSFKGLIQNYLEGILSLQCKEKTYQIPFGKIREAKLVHRFD